MCGLTGFSRHPQAPNLRESVAIVTNLLVRSQHRGRHATGIAALGGEKPFVLKKAVEADKFVASTMFNRSMDTLDPRTQVLLGHVRHATHQNAHLDEAAHPFVVGRVCGAHNGVINNWREVEERLYGKDEKRTKWLNDSQAAFGVLDRWKDPNKGLDLLDGWWALTWTRGRRLFMARTQSPELSAAYVGAWQTLFWNSERSVLEGTLKEAGLDTKDFDLWTLKPETIYVYDPMRFSKESANAEKVKASFNGQSAWARNRKVNGARPNEPVGGYSTRRTLQSTPTSTGRIISYAGSRTAWDMVSGEEIDMELATRPSSQRPEIERVWDMLAKMNSQMGALKAELETAKAEIDHLYGLLNEERPDVFESGGPYKEPPTCGVDAVMDPRQLVLPCVQGMDKLRKCEECGRLGDESTMYELPEGKFVHERCVMGEEAVR